MQDTLQKNFHRELSNLSFNYEAASTLAAMLQIGLDNERLAREIGEQFLQSNLKDDMPEVRNLFFTALISFWFNKRELTIGCLKLIVVMDEAQTTVGSISFKKEGRVLLELLKNNYSLKFTEKSVEICKIIFSEMINESDI